ncbi:glycerophosphoryl diester phosphodiesterase [Nocardioides flavus (ex Wang et al. 2016)]|uniref:glycerophosphodiester phosphodiesterase n=1 Tax=Nocardioides flavus (ex Wang et al. 2016) TaxID=2058780 RepID=A0ABQ3HIC4_9ACTN|nr:glycerophosphodiester phosphodiesterase [Nocardioides flavus (ex Wang et al. 2016)]GHE17046.1 glycerophosphoryl diester phosphodiesterase [Nocardioides flavus (ex Wang et al. 2016)]
MTSRKAPAATLVLALAAALTSVSASATASPADVTEAPLVEPVLIGHRGASGYRPEHTLAAYELAIEQGADYIEPDLVSTRDGVLVARHENEISGTTDVADHPEFADRRTTKVIDGRAVTGWFTEDFTYRELRTLRAKERLPQVRPDNTAYDGQERIPTLDQVIRLARRAGVGVYPETKHPTYFDSIGLSLEEPLVAALRKRKWDDADDPVIIQSFEVTNLRELDTMVDVPLAQLVDASGGPFDRPGTTYASMLTPAGLAEVATYADGLGANKFVVLPRGATEPTAVVADAHDAGLVVHVWTMRLENQFMDSRFKVGADPDAPGDLAAEARAFLDAGVDGIFSDHPDVVAGVLDAR